MKVLTFSPHRLALPRETDKVGLEEKGAMVGSVASEQEIAKQTHLWLMQE